MIKIVTVLLLVAFLLCGMWCLHTVEIAPIVSGLFAVVMWLEWLVLDQKVKP